MTSKPWADADLELVARTVAIPSAGLSPHVTDADRKLAEAVLDALTAAGWEARCECDGVDHNLPILRAHLRGEPGCEREANRHGG